MNGRYDDEYGGIDIWGESHSDTPSEVFTKTNYMYEFRTDEELINSAVFQRHLAKSLAHKDKTIRELQNELLKRE